jgi:hypothetical protein
MNMRIIKRRRYARYRLALASAKPILPMSDEARAWLDTTPVGREFGSPDYERLTAIDALKGFAKLQGITQETLKQWRTHGRK